MTRVVLASVPLHSSLRYIAFVIINQETEGKKSSTNLRQNFTESHLRMAAAQISSCLYNSIRDVCVSNPVRISSAARLPQKGFGRIGTTFATGSPLLIQKASYSTKAASRASSVSIKCEQSAKGGNSVDVWLGRLAMVGFAVAISVEIATGKGLLENFGLTTPLPTVALAVTALVGVLTAIFIFQSASEN